jgi:deoxyribodipyrimidine photo-lyase
VVDNHALSLATNHARQEGLPLVVLFVATVGDWKAHDRSARRVDFCLRNLRYLKVGLLVLRAGSRR